MAQPCILCVFVFFFGWKFRPGHTTHVFDVFSNFKEVIELDMCFVFFWQIWFRPGHNTHVFYMFVTENAENLRKSPKSQKMPKNRKKC